MGASTQVVTGNDMDHYAADASAVAEHLDLKNAIHIGHSTGGGSRWPGTSPGSASPRAALRRPFLSAPVPPLMVRSARQSGGTPIEVFDGYRSALASDRAQFYRDVASGPFYGFNRRGAKVSQGSSKTGGARA